MTCFSCEERINEKAISIQEENEEAIEYCLECGKELIWGFIYEKINFNVEFKNVYEDGYIDAKIEEGKDKTNGFNK